MLISDWNSYVCTSDLFLVIAVVDQRPVDLKREAVEQVDALVHRGMARVADQKGFKQDVAVRIGRRGWRRRLLCRARVPGVAAGEGLVQELRAFARLPGCGREGQPREFGLLRAISHQRIRSEEHTSELQSLMRISYAVFCLKKKIHLFFLYPSLFLPLTLYFLFSLFS